VVHAYDAWSGTQQVVRWAPCVIVDGARHLHVIHYRVNPAGHLSRVALVEHAIGLVAQATGLHFHDDGLTGYVPHAAADGTFAARSQERHAHAPLVIAWAWQGTGPGASNLLTSAESGVGTIVWRSGSGSQLRINDAGVVLRRGVPLLPGFTRGASIGTLLLHELGHAVGLEHVSDPTQVMYPVIGSATPSAYASGDRAGLARVGAANGCMHGRRLPATN
jgi:hypothetical protein